jgi:hypothetical protein
MEEFSARGIGGLGPSLFATLDDLLEPALKRIDGLFG